MAGETMLGASQSLANSTPTTISEFRLLQDEKQVMMQTCAKVPLGRNKGPTVYIDNYGRIVAGAVGDGADVANAQAIADAQTTGTPSEIAAQVVLSGRAIRQSADTNLESNAAKIVNRAMQLKREQDATAQLSGFTPSLGSAGTVISPGHAAAAVARVQIGDNRSNPEPYEDLSMVLHPYHMLVLGGTIVPMSNVPTGTNAYGANTGAEAGTTLTNAGGTGGPGSLSDDIMRKGVRAIAQLNGVPIYLTANIAINSADDGYGGCYDRSGLNYCEEVAFDMVEDRDPSMRGAVEYTAWGSYVFFLYRAAASGASMLFDASTPTS